MSEVTPELVKHAILFLIALVLSVTVHEFGHAWVATRLGDSLPRAQGRLTLSPIQHIDPIGTLLLPALALFSSLPLFGWGRPVLTNPNQYTRSLTRATGSMLVAVAGPAMNLVLAVVCGAVIVVGMRFGVIEIGLASVLTAMVVQLNLTLMLLNLLPIPPLDGGAVLAWVLPRSMQPVVEFLSRWGWIIVIGLFLGAQVGVPVLGFLGTGATFLTQKLMGGLAGVAGL